MLVKDAAIERALDRPDPQVRLYLLYGQDEAASHMLAARFAKAMGEGAERVDIEASALKGSPARLADEAASMGLFGEKRWVRVTAAADECAEAIRLLLDAPAAGSPVVIVTGALRATAASVKLVSASPIAVGHVSYTLDGAKAAGLVSAIGREHGLRIDANVAERIVGAVGADRMLIAREVEKLALYADAAPDRPKSLEVDAVDAVGAALGETDLSGLFVAVLDGDADRLAHELHAIDESGTSRVMVLRSFAGHLVKLAGMRASVDGGESIAQVTGKLFWKEQDAWRRHLSTWTAPRIATAIDRVSAAQRSIMRADPVEAGADETLMTIARAARRR